jgi:hypothetical protein
MHGHILESVQSAKYLGVTLSADLKWNNHIQQMTFKANKIVLQKNENLNESLLHCICLMVFEWVDLVLDWLGIRMLSYGTAILLLIIL